MARAKWVFSISIALLFMAGIVAGTENSVSAQESARVMTIVVPYTEYEWWLIRWQDNQILCQILIDHEGQPTLEETAVSCGDELAFQWQNTPPCATGVNCNGLYVHLIAIQEKQREVEVELPPAVVWVNLEGCTPTPPENLCPDLPVLVLRAEEPLPDERILAIQGTYEGAPFYCDGDLCKLPLRPTPINGATIEFWADSSFGDSSKTYNARVRIIDTGVTAEPGGGGWFVDVISSQWQGQALASCARIWESFPPLGTPPTWLSTPDHYGLIASEEPYYYLAGRLISQGLVDVSMCPFGGLLPNGYADTCGLEKARPAVEEWQNQFDDRIVGVAKETGVPAQLLKNLFAQESQFWPGVFRIPNEFGLGQLTDNGTDSIFIWNPDFYTQYCPLVLSEEHCARGYLGLAEEDRSLLRGALALQAKSDCPDCDTGIDLTNAHFTVQLFANTLQANCSQVSRTIYTATNAMAGEVSAYEDLWRFTVANYHAGPGCVAYAIHSAWQDTGRLTWGDVAVRFTEPCQGAVPYVEKITR